MARDGMLHIDRLGLMKRKRTKCCVCGQIFAKTEAHVYKIYHNGENFACSWSCFRRMETQIEEQKSTEKSGRRRKRTSVSRAKARIAACEKKVEHYAGEKDRAKAGSRAKKNAGENLRVWREKLKDAREVLELLNRNEGGQENEHQGIQGI